MKDNNIAITLKALRKVKNLTQKQLAAETGLSLSSIISYENGLREPNSKAMVILEKYFGVSGEFLRGELTHEEFEEKSSIITINLDKVNVLMEELKKTLAYSPVEAHKIISEIAIITLNNMLLYLEDENNRIIDPKVLDDFYKICSILNGAGQIEVIKRAWELTYIDQYK